MLTRPRLMPTGAMQRLPVPVPVPVLFLLLLLLLLPVLLLAGCGTGHDSVTDQASPSTQPTPPNKWATGSATPDPWPPPHLPVYQMPDDLCGLVAWEEFVDLYPGQARRSDGQSLRIDDPSWMRQVECLTGYGDAGDRSAVLVTVKVEVFKETLLARIAYDGIKKVDLAHAGQTFTDGAVVGPGSGYTYLDAALGLRLVARHTNLVITATVASLWHPSTLGPDGTVPADSTARLTRLTAALFTTMPHTTPSAAPSQAGAPVVAATTGAKAG